MNQLKIMERIIVQNADVVKFRDYKYYPEDNAFEILGEKYASVLQGIILFSF